MAAVRNRNFIVDANEPAASYRIKVLSSMKFGKHALHFDWVDMGPQDRRHWRKRMREAAK